MQEKERINLRIANYLLIINILIGVIRIFNLPFGANIKIQNEIVAP
jgi:hypothetical protein